MARNGEPDRRRVCYLTVITMNNDERLNRTIKGFLSRSRYSLRIILRLRLYFRGNRSIDRRMDVREEVNRVPAIFAEQNSFFEPCPRVLRGLALGAVEARKID